MGIDIDDLSDSARQYVMKALRNEHTHNPRKKENKYHAHGLWLDGLRFDSEKEAGFYSRLKLLVRAGELDGFMYHGNIVCTEGGNDAKSRATCYEPDFVLFLPDRTYRIIDTKGVETYPFKMKMKSIKERYPKIKIELE